MGGGQDPVTVSATSRTNSQLPPKESRDSGAYLGSNTRVLITLTRQEQFTLGQTQPTQITLSVFRSRYQVPLFEVFLVRYRKILSASSKNAVFQQFENHFS